MLKAPEKRATEIPETESEIEKEIEKQIRKAIAEPNGVQLLMLQNALRQTRAMEDIRDALFAIAEGMDGEEDDSEDAPNAKG